MYICMMRNKRKCVCALFLLVITTVTIFSITRSDLYQSTLEFPVATNKERIVPTLPPSVDRYVDQLLRQNNSKTDFVDESPAEDLKRKIRVLCLILTTKQNLLTRARVVNATWAKRCSMHFFVISFQNNQTSSQNNLTDIIATPFIETREMLVYKVQYALMYVYNNFIDKFDWVLKADDDTYIVMENLRYLLSQYNSSEPGYLGYHFNMYLQNSGYMSGGAGYVISNRGVRRLAEFGLTVDGACPITKSYLIPEVSEDFEIGKCLKIAGVPVLGSVDSLNRETFHPYPISQYLLESLPEYLYEWSNNKPETGVDCCSAFSISFHYMKPGLMLLVDHLLYRTLVHGRRGRDLWNVFKTGEVKDMKTPKIIINGV